MKTRLAALFVFITSTIIQNPANAADRAAFVRDFYAAYKAKDAARLAQFYTTDATLVDPSFELDLKGLDQIRALFTKALAKYESLDFPIAQTTSAGSDLIVEGSMVGKLSGKQCASPSFPFSISETTKLPRSVTYSTSHIFSPSSARSRRPSDRSQQPHLRQHPPRMIQANLPPLRPAN
jgi:hypothetical protein